MFPEGDRAVAVRCQGCGKRLGELRPLHSRGRLSYDGAWLDSAKVDRSYHEDSPILHLAHEDWLGVECKRCGRVWQGREAYLHHLLRSAKGGREVTLGAAISVSAIYTSRDW